MKKYIVILTSIVVLFATVGFAEEDKEKKETAICPKTKMDNGCLDCHVAPDFKLKEQKPDAHLVYPTNFHFLNYPENPEGSFSIGGIGANLPDQIEEIIIYLKRHKVSKLILDVHSAGGSVFDAWKVKGLLTEFENGGGIVETRLRGMALSAGFIIFCAGTKGHRYATPEAELMLHEIGLYKGGLFYIEKVTPSSAEEEARILRHLQQTICDWLSTRGKLSSKELFEKARQREFWMNGKEAFEYGFVDILIKD